MAASALDADVVVDGHAAVSVGSKGDEVEIMMLGAGQEVGRSCCVIRYKGATVVCDAGWHPALTGLPALPFIDELDWSTVDCILVSHFHIDHAASLPYIMEKTNFKDGGGKVYMTSATKEIYGILMKDFVRMNIAISIGGEKIFDEETNNTSYEAIQAVGFGEEVFVPSRSDALSTTIASDESAPPITFTSYAAGHVLGAAMFLIQIAGARILYTGDYSTEEDRHLIPASLPIWSAPPDVMICESTFGVQVLEPREEKEPRLTDVVRTILKRGGRVLMPVFALGRAQELLLILDEYWSAHPELEQYPIYYISSLAARCMKVYLNHTASLNSNVRNRAEAGDHPFTFQRGRFIKELKDINRTFADRGPCVVLSSPAFLTSGASRQLLEKWAPDKRNGLILTGYSVEGTLARDLQKEPEFFESLEGKRIPCKMTINVISFAAHVDFAQNSRFIDEVKPAHLVLVHGEENNVKRLRDALKSNYATRKQDVQIYTPRNTERLRIKLARNRIARAVGRLAETAPVDGATVSGLLVAKDSTYTLLAPDDLREFTGLSTSIIAQKQRIRLNVGWDLVRYHLENMYGSIRSGVDSAGLKTFRVMDTVDVKHASQYEILIEWIGSTANDMIADSVLALLFGIDSSLKSIEMTSGSPHHHATEAADAAREIATERLDRLIGFLSLHFGDVELLSAEDSVAAIDAEARSAADSRAPVEGAEDGMPDDDAPLTGEGSEEEEQKKPLVDAGGPALRIRVDDHSAFILVSTMAVECSYEPLKQRVHSIVGLAVELCTPLSAASWLHGGLDAS